MALWEVGNESYSCYEGNNHLVGRPTYVKGYVPDGPVCPVTSVMAESYAVNALPYLNAMKRVSPTAQIGVPWAFSGDEARGAGVTDAATWDRTVLGALGGHIGFVDAHWYPFDPTTGLTDEQILSSIGRIPSAAARIRTALHRYSPGANFVVGEMNISERLAPLDFQPVSALFAAATSLEWLVQGAESADWWDLNNFGSPSTGDYGLVTSGGEEARSAGTALPPYYGEGVGFATDSHRQLSPVNRHREIHPAWLRVHLGRQEAGPSGEYQPKRTVVPHAELVRECIGRAHRGLQRIHSENFRSGHQNNGAVGSPDRPARLLHRCPFRAHSVALTAERRTGQRSADPREPAHSGQRVLQGSRSALTFTILAAVGYVSEHQLVAWPARKRELE